MVSDLVGGVAEHKDDLFASLSDTAEADCEAVSGEDGEDNAHGAAAKLCFNVGSDVINRYVVALNARNNRFGDRDNVLVAKRESLAFSRLDDGIGDYCRKIVAFTEDGATDTAGNCTYFSCVLFHNFIS
jgi:hypothetical protein